MSRKGLPNLSHRARRPRSNLLWQDRAACVDANPRIFFDPDRYADALIICAGCPVKDPCRELGRNTEGVWGARVNQRRVGSKS